MTQFKQFLSKRGWHPQPIENRLEEEVKTSGIKQKLVFFACFLRILLKRGWHPHPIIASEVARSRAMKKNMAAGLILVLVMVLVGTSSTLMAGKDSSKGYLGVNIEKMSPEDKDEFGVKFGVLVIKVIKDEAADKAGIKKYDVIQYFNDERIRRPGDLVEATRDSKPGAKVKIKLVRDEKEMALNVTLGEFKSKPFSFNWEGKDGKKFLFAGGRAYLGVHLQELNKDLAEYFSVKEDEGALIVKVAKDSPAEKAGLKAGDVIVKLNGESVSKAKDITKILSDLEKDDKVDIEIVRHKKKQTVKAQLDERQISGRIKILEGDFLDGLGDKLHFETPEFHYYIPHHDQEHDLILKEKMKKKVKKVKEKLHRVNEKLKRVEEYVYI